jgi:type IV pilus assembly protein PilA
MKTECSGSHKVKFARNSGFSLIELLIVVAIILIIAAIAIPNLLRARISANEASAVSSLHGVTTGEVVYSTLYPVIGYSANLKDLGPGAGGVCPGTATATCIIQDPALAAGAKNGYLFTYVQNAGTTPSSAFTVNADPAARSVTGERSFYADQTNAIHFNLSAVAGPNDPSL